MADIRDVLAQMAGIGADVSPEAMREQKRRSEATDANTVIANAMSYGIMDLMLQQSKAVPQEFRPEVMINGLVVAMAECLVILSSHHAIRKNAVKSMSKASMAVAEMITDRFATGNFNTVAVSDMVARRQAMQDRLEEAREDFWRFRFKDNTKSD